MPRIARIVAPGIPHHIIQRGNRRQKTFFCNEDYQHYLNLLAEWSSQCGVQIWVYCLMTNHVHMIAVPKTAEGLRFAIGETHRRYTRHINFREGWRGYLWQGRFSSYPMDETYLLATARYIELNPVRAGIVQNPQDYPWSSAKAHLYGRPDPLIKGSPLLDIIPNWQEFLSQPLPGDQTKMIEKHERTGRPLCSPNPFLEKARCP